MRIRIRKDQEVVLEADVSCMECKLPTSYDGYICEIEVPTPRPQLDPYTVTLTELEFACKGQKIQAIKEHRTRTGAGLKESKDIIDAAVFRAADAFNLPITCCRYHETGGRRDYGHSENTHTTRSE
jgi:hypothetical protein